MKNIRASLLCTCLIALLLASSGCTGGLSGIPFPAQAVSVASQQQTYTSNETLVAFVDSAAAYVRSNGTEKALAEFNNPNGSFIQGELYIYAYGFNGTTLAHPVNPESVGKAREGAIGVFVTEMGTVVRNGSGFYRFTYVNPQHNRTLESKLGYGIKIDDDWWIGSGVYNGPVVSPAVPSPAATGT